MSKNVQPPRAEVQVISTRSTLSCGGYLPGLTIHHILFLSCLLPFRPPNLGGQTFSGLPSLPPSLQLSKSFKAHPKPPLFQKALTDTPVWNNSAPGLCAETGVLSAPATLYLALGHGSAGLSSWWRSHGDGSVWS